MVEKGSCSGCSCGANSCGADADGNNYFLCAIQILSRGEEPKLVDFARAGTAHVSSRGLKRKAARGNKRHAHDERGGRAINQGRKLFDLLHPRARLAVRLRGHNERSFSRQLVSIYLCSRVLVACGRKRSAGASNKNIKRATVSTLRRHLHAPVRRRGGTIGWLLLCPS